MDPCRRYPSISRRIFSTLASALGVAGLTAYHLACHWLHARLQAGEPPWTSRSLRIWNEVSTLFLVGIVFLVVVKDGLSLVYGVVGLVIFASVLMAGIVAYRRVRLANARAVAKTD